MIGKSLGHYEILDPLGSGGMGDVYLGKDTRLGRKVAIKVLPAEFAEIPERLARFEQEARAAAALNHPHIAMVHDVGSETGEDGVTTHFMVQEYLEGQNLRERLDTGALPLDKALDLATEVGEALIAAHKAGIVHRDLKPDNIFVTEEGHAKVLDFGLAKLTEAAVPAGSEATMSPTMLGTVAGQVMGTAGYMAPEQVQGEEVDHRADLFAFGAVFYEMVTGRRAFAGDNIHETLSRIISQQPQAVHEIRDDLPLKVGWIISKALAKNMNRRYQSATGFTADLAQLHDDIVAGVVVAVEAGHAAAAPEGLEAIHGFRWTTVVPVAIALVGLTALATWVATRPPPLTPEPPMRFEIELPEDVAFSRTGRHVLAVSPDGRRIAFTGNEQLWIRSLDELEPTPLRDTDDPSSPFFSPDGQQLGFWSAPDGEIKRVAVTGGTPTPLASASNLYGASWAEDGMIYYGQGSEGIWRVSEDGGEPERVVAVQEGELAHGPQLLPGGEWILFTLLSAGPESEWNDASIVVESLTADVREVLVVGGTQGRYVPTDHIVYFHDGGLFAVPFDLDIVEPATGQVSVVEGVAKRGNYTGAVSYEFSASGTLVYVSGSGTNDYVRELAFVDAAGNTQVLGEAARPGAAWQPRLSPDETRLAYRLDDAQGASNIWILDLELGTNDVFTTNNVFTPDGTVVSLAWSPDGQWIYYAAGSEVDWDIYRRRADFSAAAEPVLNLDDLQVVCAISHDGEWLLYGDRGEAGYGIWLLPLESDAEPQPLLMDPVSYRCAKFSPDGGRIAFTSDKDGSDGVYVQSFPTASAVTKVSTSGGREPLWSPDGRRLYYRDGRDIMAVDFDDDEQPSPARVFLAGGLSTFGQTAGSYDITDDGQQFVMFLERDQDATVSSQQIIIVLNWFEELNQLVPTGR